MPTFLDKSASPYSPIILLFTFSAISRFTLFIFSLSLSHVTPASLECKTLCNCGFNLELSNEDGLTALWLLLLLDLSG